MSNNFHFKLFLTGSTSGIVIREKMNEIKWDGSGENRMAWDRMGQKLRLVGQDSFRNLPTECSWTANENGLYMNDIFPIDSRLFIIKSGKYGYPIIICSCSCTLNIFHSHLISRIHKKYCSSHSCLYLTSLRKIYHLLPITIAPIM